jgi:uncharacterized protein YcfJ
MKTARLIRCIFLVTAIAFNNANAKPPSDPTVRRAREKFDSRRTYAEGVTAGATIGAVVGGILGGIYAATHNGNVPQAAGVGALIGAGAGGIAGHEYADQKVRQRREYLARETALNNAIKNAKSTRLATQDFNRVLAGRIRNVQQQSKASTLADARAVQSAVEREIARQRNTLARSSLSESDRNSLNAEINALTKEQRQLQANIDRFARSIPSARATE